MLFFGAIIPSIAPIAQSCSISSTHGRQSITFAPLQFTRLLQYRLCYYSVLVCCCLHIFTLYSTLTVHHYSIVSSISIIAHHPTSHILIPLSVRLPSSHPLGLRLSYSSSDLIPPLYHKSRRSPVSAPDPFPQLQIIFGHRLSVCIRIHCSHITFIVEQLSEQASAWSDRSRALTN